MDDLNRDFDPGNPFASPLESSFSNPFTPNAELEDIEIIRHNHLNHEASIKSVGLLFILGGVLGLLYTTGMVFGLLMMPMRENQLDNVAAGLAVGLVILILIGGLSGLQLWSGVGLRQLNPKVAIPATVVAAFGLLGIPVGTIISIYILWLLQSKKGKYILSEPYQAIVAQTPHIKYRTSLIVKILLVLLGLVLLLAVLGCFLGAIFD